VIDVAGAVRQPGIYQLAPDSRVQVAIEAAGGVLDEADLRGLSLARSLQDGEKLYVPAQGETPPLLPTPEPSLSGEKEAPAEIGFPINVNQASVEALEALPGIGPKTAQAIVDYRQASGPFPTVDSITAVKGIGQGTLEKIRALIVVE
jgi:competence protein ComEA